jgi:hypothetical protein
MLDPWMDWDGLAHLEHDMYADVQVMGKATAPTPPGAGLYSTGSYEDDIRLALQLSKAHV